MALGDLIIFDQYLLDCTKKLHDISTDTLKVALITSAVTPTTATSDPRWGTGGSTDLSANEVTAGGNYTAGGATLASVTNALSGGAAVFDAADTSWAQHASNPTTGRWAIIYNSTDTGKRAIGAIDLGSAIDMTTGSLTLTYNASGITSTNQA